MNLDAQLDVIDLTTLARAKGLMPQSQQDEGQDDLIARLIADQSAMISRHIGLHLSTVARVETYELRQHARVLSLDAKPVSAITEILESASIPDDWTTIAATSSSLYVLNKAAGWIRFLKSRANDPGFIRVSYTGGFGTDTDGIIAAFPDLSHACDLAVKYEMERLNTLGGDITTIPGASTTFGGQYQMHKEVARLLGYHRRGTV